MAREAKIFQATVFQGLPAVFFAVVQNLNNGEPLTAAEVSTIVYDLFDLDSATPETPVQTGTVTVNTALHALKKDPRWNEDTTGYNFDHLIPGAYFTASGKTYVLRYLFTAIGDTAPSAVLVFNIYVLSTRG